MDRISKDARSRNMTRIRSKGNRTTEKRMRALLSAHGFREWCMHAAMLGNPDFVFARLRVAVFIDGCFWHGCPACGHIPKSNRRYWKPKLERTVARDKRYTNTLRSRGWAVMRIWEHELRSAPSEVIKKLRRLLLRRAARLSQ